MLHKLPKISATRAPLASPVFTGVPAAPTPALATSTTQLATTAFVRTGVTDGSNAAAGQVGEYVQSTAGGGALTTNTPANAGSITLTAGDWDVQANCNFTPSGNPTITAIQLGLNTTSATFAGGPPVITLLQAAFAVGGAHDINTGVGRFTLAVTTVVYAVALSNFSPGGVSASAILTARRAR